jgi:hypothetical protein
VSYPHFDSLISPFEPLHFRASVTPLAVSPMTAGQNFYFILKKTTKVYSTVKTFKFIVEIFDLSIFNILTCSSSPARQNFCSPKAAERPTSASTKSVTALACHDVSAWLLPIYSRIRL